MNILVIGKFYIEGFGLHIAETLEDMGHVVRRFEPGYRSSRFGGSLGHRIDQVGRVLRQTTESLPAMRSWCMKELWILAEQAPLDVVIVIHDFLWPAEVAELKRRTGAAVALWFPDCLVNFGRAFFMNAPYDGLFFKDPFIVHRLKDVLTNPVYYLPECFNPAKHCVPDVVESELAAYRCDVTTAGTQHSWRVALFRHLAEYNVKIWGPPGPLWLDVGPVAKMYQGRPVHNQDKARAFRAAKIVLNNLHYGEMWGINIRAFEIAGARGFQLIDWRPGLSQIFEDRKELICYHSVNDLKQKINYWLPRDDERKVIATAGMQRAFAEHTYRLRLELLLETLAGRAHGFPCPENNEGWYPKCIIWQ
jgi:spore maturation protein CgeB